MYSVALSLLRGAEASTSAPRPADEVLDHQLLNTFQFVLLCLVAALCYYTALCISAAAMGSDMMMGSPSSSSLFLSVQELTRELVASLSGSPHVGVPFDDQDEDFLSQL